MTYLGSKIQGKHPRIIKARKSLQAKIGTGQIDPFKLQKMQEYLDNLTIDYEPIAKQHIARIEEILAALPEPEYDREHYLQEILKPIMELKATGGMFNEHVISNISGGILAFLEHTKKLDEEVIDILRAHNDAVRTAMAMKVRSLEDQKARDLIMEINKACKRYYQKYQAKLR